MGSHLFSILILISSHQYFVHRNNSPSSVLSADDCTMGKTSDKEPDQVFEILNQSIWNNKYILKQDESLFYPYLRKKGISQIKDLINDNATTSLFLNWNSGKHKFSFKPNDFMSWTSILETIPATWKKKLRENELLNVECQEIPSSALSVKASYLRLQRPIIEKPTSQETISMFLGITEINWSKVFMTH